MLPSVVVKWHEDLSWPFESGPQYRLDHDGHHSVVVDPAPAYKHNVELVRVKVHEIAKAFPITWPVTFYVLSHEFTSRTNAFAQGNAFDYRSKLEDYDEGDEQYLRCPYIVMSGKRIPIMPAMTRYLVAHEYGHIVEDWIAKQRKQRDSDLLKEYAELRRIKFPLNYGCGTWHETPGEIFANDFRILVGNAEVEFWPHECQRPEDNYAVIGWWEKAKELCTATKELCSAQTVSNGQPLTKQ